MAETKPEPIIIKREVSFNGELWATVGGGIGEVTLAGLLNNLLDGRVVHLREVVAAKQGEIPYVDRIVTVTPKKFAL